MKLQEKIKSWCKDEKFMSFAQERARKEVCEVTENHRIDPQYEELDEAFEYDDRYIAPLVTYLTYKLRLALQVSAKEESGGCLSTWRCRAITWRYSRRSSRIF